MSGRGITVKREVALWAVCQTDLTENIPLGKCAPLQASPLPSPRLHPLMMYVSICQCLKSRVSFFPLPNLLGEQELRRVGVCRLKALLLRRRRLVQAAVVLRPGVGVHCCTAITLSVKEERGFTLCTPETSQRLELASSSSVLGGHHPRSGPKRRLV